MGFADRDYYREPSGSGGMAALRLWSVNTWLIVINIAVFCLDSMLNGSISPYGYFSVTTAVIGLEFWRFITFQFLHAGPSHIFFNMLGLYFFGPIVESHLGSRRYLAFYLLSGIGGALGYIVLSTLGILITNPNDPLIGASAGIFGVLIGVAQIGPDIRVMLLFPPIPMRMRTMAWVYIGIAVYVILTSGPNAGGQAAHLGGALVGYILIRNDRWLNFADFSRSRRRRRMLKDWSKDFNR
jgi:membrane associated rhomboid family serine protease